MPMNEDLLLIEVSPLLVFHQLFDMDEVDEARRITVVALSLVFSLPLVLAQCKYTSHFCTILSMIGGETDHSEVAILHYIG